MSDELERKLMVKRLLHIAAVLATVARPEDLIAEEKPVSRRGKRSERAACVKSARGGRRK